MFDSVVVTQTPVREGNSSAPAEASKRRISQDPLEHRLFIGVSRQNSIELRIRIKKDGPYSFAIVQAVNILVAALRQLDNAQAVRDDRLSIWPRDADATGFGRWTVSGHL